MHLEQIPRAQWAICPAQMPEKWLGKQGPEPEDFIPNMLAFAPSLLIESLVLVLPWKRSFDDWSNSLDNQKVSCVPLCINIVRTANH
jgi:hypothetical protein